MPTLFLAAENCSNACKNPEVDSPGLNFCIKSNNRNKSSSKRCCECLSTLPSQKPCKYSSFLHTSQKSTSSFKSYRPNKIMHFEDLHIYYCVTAYACMYVCTYLL